MVDDRESVFQPSKDQIGFLCDRHFGIGSDGLILIRKSAEADFEMVFYNPDSSQSFCGNGSRCAVSFAHTLEIIDKTTTFKAIDGIHHAKMKDDMIAISMKNPGDIEQIGDDLLLHTGSPHFIRFAQSIIEADLIPVARAIRYNDRFRKEGVNVNLVESIDAENIFVRTYERGVEDETLSCGTGVTAAALAQASKNPAVQKVRVKTKGGDLLVNFDRDGKQFSNTWLSGPAIKVYDGEIDLVL